MFDYFKAKTDFSMLRALATSPLAPNDPNLFSWFLTGSGCLKEINVSEEHFDDLFDMFSREVENEDEAFSFLDGLLFAAVTQEKNGLFFRFIAYIHESEYFAKKISWDKTADHIRNRMKTLLKTEALRDYELVAFSNSLRDAFHIDNTNLFPLVFYQEFSKHDFPNNVGPLSVYLEKSPLTDEQKALGVFLLRKTANPIHFVDVVLSPDAVNSVFLDYYHEENRPNLCIEDVLFCARGSITPETHKDLPWEIFISAVKNRPDMAETAARWGQDHLRTGIDLHETLSDRPRKKM